MTGAERAARTCVSSDGVVLGSVVGIHRDPHSGVARWAVVDSGDPGRRFLVVPLAEATTASTGLRVPYPAAQVLGAPGLAEPTPMRRSEEALLLRHYGLADATPPPGSTAPARSPSQQAEPLITMIRHEEQVSVSSLEWRPYQRVTIRKVVRTEEVTEVVTVRREELVVEDQPITPVERLDAALGTATTAPAGELEIVLHREEYVVQKRVVAYERVRVSTARVTADWPLEGTLRKERIDVEREPAGDA